MNWFISRPSRGQDEFVSPRDIDIAIVLGCDSPTCSFELSDGEGRKVCLRDDGGCWTRLKPLEVVSAKCRTATPGQKAQRGSYKWLPPHLRNAGTCNRHLRRIIVHSWWCRVHEPSTVGHVETRNQFRS
jgi:3-hydroxyacyl-CoA dehydrogenase